MNIPKEEQIKKLPVWAKDYIANLERRTVIAERTLKEFEDNQTESPVFYWDYCCIGEGSPKHVTRYVQTQKISVKNNGVLVDVSIHNSDGVEISWSSENGLSQECAMVPRSYQMIKITKQLRQ